MRTALASILLFSATAVQAQSWSEVQQLPANAEVRIEERGGRGGAAQGILQSVEDLQLTIVRGKSPINIPRDRIGRVQVRTGDPVWDGGILMLIPAAISHAAFGTGGGWSGRETVWNYVGSFGVGVLFDWGHQSRRTVYKAP